MLTIEERNGLQDLLSHAVNPVETMTLEQLEGYLFGLAITPEVTRPMEWFLDIFGEAFARFDDAEQSNKRFACLTDVYNRLNTLRLQGELRFPFDLDDIDPPMLKRLRGWVAGFDRALALRSYLWMPDEVLDQPEMNEDDEKIMTCLMVVLGVAQPDKIPEIFEEIEENGEDEHEIWAHLVGQLPQAVETLLDYSGKLDAHRTTSL
jgi:yecA family protein